MGRSEDRKERKRHRSRSPSESRSRKYRGSSRDRDSHRRGSSRSPSNHKSRKSERDRDRDRERDRDRDKEKKGKDRDRDRDREKDRDRRKERDRERDRDNSKESDRSRSKDRERSKERDRNRHKDSDKLKDRERSGRTREEKEKDKASAAQKIERSEEQQSELERLRDLENAQLEEEMRKRRERIRAWQEARAKIQNTGENTASVEVAEVERPVQDGEGGEGEPQSSKEHTWTLEDEDEDEEAEPPQAVPAEGPALPSVAKRAEEEDEVAPSLSAQKPKTKASRFSTAPPADQRQQQSAAAAMEEEDPLDAFMSSLYGSGDVATQNGAAPKVADKTAAAAAFTFEENEEELQAKVNPYGSNTITMEEILSSLRADGQPSEGARIHRGWESENELDGSVSPQKRGAAVAMAVDEPAETEEEREAREERERREFVEAIRRAREEEDQRRDQLARLDEQLQRRESERARQVESLGRVFAEEGDVMDEREIEEKKRSALELLEEAKRGKVLKEVDHSKVQYLPFRKNLYIVPKALARLSEEEQLQKRDQLQIRVRGKGCPAPVDSWEQCGLSDRILGCIYGHGLKEPFAIQRQAIPAIMCGRDVIGVAKTGSGKTLAFLLPMFRHIQDQPPLGDNEGPIGLVMAPARELAFQITNEAKKFMKALGLRVACVYGGAGVAEQIADLKRGSEIVVCTPGRMIDILCMQAGKLVSLRRVTMVVLDEADRMFDMGFEPQIKMILQNVRPDRQTVLFSATFPKQIEKLARSILKLPLEIVVGERSTVNKDITQYVEVHEEEDKFLRLLQLLGVWYEKGSVLIFVDKQEKCDQLFQELLKLGYPCLSLHGGKDQVDRDHTLHEFKTGVKTVMIATSVAGRGLDVPEIVCVVNFNCPNHLEDYVHRVGRTGRAGRKGTAYTFISSKEDQYAPIMMRALSKAGQPVPAELEALAQQFQEKVERGEAHHVGSGFVGKGFTFDASELNEAQRIALMQKKAYEIEEGLVPEAEEADDEYDELYDEDRTVGLAPSVATEPPSTAATSSLAAATAVALGPAAANPTDPAAAGGSIDAKAALARAKLIAMQLAVKKDGGSEYYAEELDINDYPIQARRKVTNRNALDDVTERTGAAVVSRGVYIAPGKKAELGERRLHLLIEGKDELSVRQAKLEIQRALEEETIKQGLATKGMPSGGRYSVV